MAGVVTTLRNLVPLRALTQVEALRIAELQAARLLELAGVGRPPVAEALVTGLPRLQVERVALGDTSGAAQWSHGRWLILLNASESPTRQRFSLAHEFKHVLDNPFVRVLYPDIRGMASAERRERICDHFAACLLMPRAWVKHQFCDDKVQDVRRLARRFEVSQAAMRYRLHQIGLVEPPSRCAVAA